MICFDRKVFVQDPLAEGFTEIFNSVKITREKRCVFYYAKRLARNDFVC